jgi:hypothetical protein
MLKFLTPGFALDIREDQVFLPAVRMSLRAVIIAVAIMIRLESGRRRVTT